MTREGNAGIDCSQQPKCEVQLPLFQVRNQNARMEAYRQQRERCVARHFQVCLACTVPLSLFADPERILRRLYVFAEEPCKSSTTTSEPCSSVFKEVQPRPSEHSNLEYHINNLNLYLHVFGLLII